MPCCYRVLTAPKTPVPRPPAPAGDLPTRLRRLRLSLRLTKADMAERLGAVTGVYLRWESGEDKPNLRALPRLWAALGAAPPAPATDTLGGCLKAWRLAGGLSLVEAAALAGVDRKTYHRVERDMPVCRRSRRAAEALLGPTKLVRVTAGALGAE